jgi:hypothetical protein
MSEQATSEPQCENCTRTDTGPATVIVRATWATREGGVVVDRELYERRCCWACAFALAVDLTDREWDDVALHSDSGRVWRELGR